MLFDDGCINPIELHGHGPACSKGVAAHLCGGKSKPFKTKGFYRSFHCLVDVGGRDLLGCSRCGIVGADCDIVIAGGCHDVCDTPGKSFDGTCAKSGALTVDALPFFPVFLVGDTKGCMLSLEEFMEGGRVGNEAVVPTAKGDVLDTKPLCPATLLLGSISIFANSEEVVESYADQVTNGLCFWIIAAKACQDQVVGDSDWDCQLLFGRWVLTPVGLYLLLQGWPVECLRLVVVRGAGLVSQLEGLGDGCQRLLNARSADSIFVSGISIAYPTGKGLDKGEPVISVEGPEVGVSDGKDVVQESGPMAPVSFPRVVSLSHDPMGCRSSRSSEKTKAQTELGRVCMCQEASCVSGKRALNLVSNSVAVRL